MGEKGAPDRDLQFVVLGMGRLGLSEFDLASDADLVFVAGPEVGREDLERWTHLAEKTIEVKDLLLAYDELRVRDAKKNGKADKRVEQKQ
jgi:glutamine synthetase adenylyltransferase